MVLRNVLAVSVLAFAVGATGCGHHKVANPIANVDSKQPDKVLFDRGIDAMSHGKYDVARLTFQTLINTYPDSEFVARAKLGVADSWYEEGGSANWQQAEAEYRDFQTFFPNMAEAAEAQLKIASMQYKQMEKPDRDFTHAKRAEDEYRALIQQYPDSKLVPEAKQKLREVQEVLAEREFRIGRFYYLKDSFAASEARLKTLADTYPLYSKADEALMMLGSSFEKQAELVRNTKGIETAKAKMIAEFQDGAASAFDRVIQRYPASDLADDARSHLKALGRPIPTPTPEAIAQNKAEIESRGETGRIGRIMFNLKKRPDVATAAKVGEPTMTDPEQTSAVQIVRNNTNAMKNALGMKTDDSSKNAAVEVVKPGTLPKTDAAPRSDLGQEPPATNPNGGNEANAATEKGVNSDAAQAGSDSTTIPELKINGGASTTAAPNTMSGDTSAAGTTQGAAGVNSTQPSGAAGSVGTTNPPKDDKAATDQKTQDEKNSSTSKKKKKKFGIF